MAVKFLVGTAERYAQLKKDGHLNAESFYRIEGTNDMYIGTRKLTSEEDVQKALGYIGTLTNLQTNVKTNLVAALNEIKGALDATKTVADSAQANVNALKAKVGTVPENKTVVQMISEAITTATYDDTAVKASIKANKDAITVLNGNGEGSVSKKVADAVASIVADAPAAYDTLKEISDWISSHAGDASTMNSQIQTNKTDIAGLKTLIGKLPSGVASTTIVGYIAEAIGTSKTELTSAIATAKSEAITTAKNYTDGLAKNYATAAQGAKADTAVQNISEGTTNGAFLVDSAIVKVHGLGDAAYKAASAFDAAGTATTKANQVLGKASDNKDANTVYGAKAYAKAYADTAIANAALVWETF